MPLTTRLCPWGCGTPLTFRPEPDGEPARCAGCGRRAAIRGDRLICAQSNWLERIVQAAQGMIDALRHFADQLTSPTDAPPEPPRARPAPTRPVRHTTSAQSRPRDRRPERSPATRRY